MYLISSCSLLGSNRFGLVSHIGPHAHEPVLFPLYDRGAEQCTIAERERESPHGAFSIVPVVMGPPDPVIAALRLCAGPV